MSDHPTPRTHAALKKTQGMFRASAAANGFAEFARQLERELADARAAILKMHKDLGYELRDPNGTIWDEASRLKRENDMFREVLTKISTMEDGHYPDILHVVDLAEAALAKTKS